MAADGLVVKLTVTGGVRTRAGQAVRLDASLENTTQEAFWYRFRVRGPGEGAWRMVRDYGPRKSFAWVPAGRSGAYEIEVSARGRETGRTAAVIHRQEVVAIAGPGPAASPTEHPLVFFYSAPPCPGGGRMQVAFATIDGIPTFTSSKQCDGVSEMNFYLAGLRAATPYAAKHMVWSNEGFAEGPLVFFETPPVDLQLVRNRVLRPAPASASGILVLGTLFQVPTAIDLRGNLVWYYPFELQYLTRPAPGGHFLALLENHEADTSEQRFIKFDLAGNTVLETNAARVNEQLAEMGMNAITSFHHEARELPDGRFLLLAGTERILKDVQGPGEVDVIGDTIVVLDANLQVVWAWDAFDHLDVSRLALADEKCVPGGGGCPAFYLAAQGNDWLHGNSLQLTPDGHILYSARHQDWLIKIEYANGAGSGKVLWRLGKDGDFQMESSDAWPWFSHQHDGQILAGGRVLVFDNSNARYEFDPAAQSRGQLIELDETKRTARLVLNVDLGAYAFALGSAQLLDNGNYHFNLGWTPGAASQALEYTRQGELVFQLETATQQYRSFRMADLYTP